MRTRCIFGILALAGAYWITGRLGLLLAIPPGYATAVWPPSGLALAGLLIFGRRLWPGVLLGSFLVNITTSLDASSLAAAIRTTMAALSIAGGASLEAVVGVALIRRTVALPVELTTERDIVRFFLLGGPVSCVVNATIGVCTLAATGLITPSQFAFSWWTWWIGDSIGVAVIAPLLMIAFGKPREVWRRRALSVGLPLAIMLGLVTGLFVIISSWEQARAQAAFVARTNTVSNRIREHVEDATDVLYALEGLRASSQFVDRDEFRTFATLHLRRYPALSALSWNPVVTHAEREAFERDYTPLLEMDAGRLVPAAPRACYVAVAYIAPEEGHKTALGFDVSSEASRAAALNQARETGKATSTTLVRLVQESGGSGNLLIFLPVREDYPPRVSGFYAGAFNLERLFAPIHPLSTDIQMSVTDEAGSLFDSHHERHVSEHVHTATLSILGRTWRLRYSATAAYVSAHRSWGPWTVLASGMVVIALLVAFLLAATGRAVTIERLGVARAQELSKSNADLARQIEERRVVEEALRGKEIELRQVQKMETIGRLAGGIAHDFNNLLTPILGYSQLLLEEPVSTQAREYLEEIHKAGDRASRLTRQLLAFSRKQVLQPRLVNLGDVLSDFQKLLRRVIGEDIAFTLIQGPGPHLVHVDPGQFEQVIMNLVVNARDAMPRGGSLTIQTANVRLEASAESPAGPYVEVRVADSGCGMDERTKSHLFEPFFTTKPPGQGTGLGLATVHGIVRQSRGRLDVESELGKGTTVRIFLPAREGTPETADTVRLAVPVAGNGTILLVEDEPVVLRFAAEALRARGYRVLESSEGDGALKAATECPGPIDLVISDMVMPGRNGLEVVRELRAGRPAMRAMLMTGYSEMMASEAFGAMKMPLLKKPFTGEELVGRVSEVLAHRTGV